MKKIKPSYLYLFALVMLSHPSYAQEQAPKIVQPVAPSLVGLGMPTAQPVLPAPASPDISLPPQISQAGAPPVLPTGQLFPAQLPHLPPPALPNVGLVPVDYYRPTSDASAKEVDSILNAADMQKFGLKLAFHDDDSGDKGVIAALEGSLPAACLQNMVMDVVKRSSDSTSVSKDDEDFSSPRNNSSSDSESEKKIAKIDDLDAESSRVGVRVIFKGNDKTKTLSDCVSAEKSSPIKDVSTNDKLSKPILDDGEKARLGLMDSSGKIAISKTSPESPAYHEIAKILNARTNAKVTTCEDCLINAADDADKHSELSEDITLGFLKDMETIAAKELQNAHDLKSLEKARTDILTFQSKIRDYHISTDQADALNAEAEDLLAGQNGVQTKAGQIAKQDPKNADDYASFISETGAKIARLSGISEETRKQQNLVVDAYAKGGSMRMQFIQSINPGDKEVEQYLSQDEYKVQAAKNDATAKYTAVLQACQANQFQQFVGYNKSNSNACAQAQSSWNVAKATYYNLSIPYQTALKNYESAIEIPKSNAQNSFGKAGMNAPTGGYALPVTSVPAYGANQSGLAPTQSLAGLGLPPVQNTTGLPSFMTSVNQNQFSPQAPLYQTSYGSQYNTVPAIPLNSQMPVYGS
jgi:hypothetical protein